MCVCVCVCVYVCVCVCVCVNAWRENTSADCECLKALSFALHVNALKTTKTDCGTHSVCVEMRYKHQDCDKVLPCV